MDIVNFSSQSHQGPFLNQNEDGYDFDIENQLYMIFDGFGGHNVGDKAVEEIKINIKKFFNSFTEDRDATLPFYFSPKYLIEGNVLINAMLLSHYELYKKNLERELEQRAGASGLLAIGSESVLTLASTGNCRAYLIRKGHIEKIFSEDSMQMLRKDNFESHLKNIPLSGFGLFPDLHYQVKEIRITEGDKIIFLTDGAYARVEDREVMSCLTKPTIDLKTKIQEVFDLSNDRGNLDNQTCMILEY
ncbi:MAG: hypothetical protein CME62_16105 [Halobacteriovoraceae bacterium]|nr:hypothetical protein [Halobacteriovoraceae bacterium]|tara:strand:- start:21868 stop:22605 length:738 start_codon:yes stop_codon:yes gene_type:complete